jgi:magnesium chelatase family protein
MIQRYQGRISGPLMDRIDIHVDVPRVEYDKLMGMDKGEPSVKIRQRVQGARDRQQRRFEGLKGLYANADMGPGEIQQHCSLTAEARQVLELSVRQMQLSARAYHRVMKLSRTIADLGGSDQIEVVHVAEALQYRPKEGYTWKS